MFLKRIAARMENEIRLQAMLNGLEVNIPTAEEDAEEPAKLTPAAEEKAQKLLEKIKEDIKSGRPRADNKDIR